MPRDGAAAPQQQITPQQANMMARNACIRQGVNMWQQIYTETVSANVPGTFRNIPLRQVGLAKRLLIRVSATVQANGQTLTRAPFGPSQIFSNVQVADLSNQTRINTPGWHLHGVASAKRRKVFAAAYTSDTPTGYGSNFGQVCAAPASITTNPVANNVFMDFEIPLAYTDHDLRGALYLNVTNATAYLQYTVNPNWFVSNTGDPTLAVYQSSSGTAGIVSSLTITVYQNYLDQLPLSSQGPVLPLLDLSTAYLMNTTPVTATVINQDIPIAYANFRDFLSTFLIFDNGGVLNPGTDINYIAIQSANFTNILKYDPYVATLLAREIFMDDPPAGVYYTDHRQKPISTIQYGNMQMVVSLLSAAANGQFIMGFEQMALINQITQAGSLYGTG